MSETNAAAIVAQPGLAPGPEQGHDLDAVDECLPLLKDLLARYGDTCRVPGRSRRHDGLVIHDPDDIRRVLLTNRANYVKGVGLERVRMLLGNGLIVSDGDFWARQRRMMQPAFQNQVIRGFSGLMQRLNLDLLERWSGAAARGETVNVTRDVSELALGIVLHALFGADLERLVAAEGASPFDMLTRDSRRDLQFAAQFRALTRFVRAMIEARRREQRVEPDLLSMLMQARDRDSGEPMPERALLDEVMSLIVAGHETTASTLNWTWYLLSQHPGVEARLHEVLAAGAGAAASAAGTSTSATGTSTRAQHGGTSASAGDDASAEDGYVAQVLQEALRLHPPVWLFSRRALAEDRLGGYAVAPGTDVFICPYLLHRHPAHWERPEAFEPERFAPAAVAARHRFAYLPFSAGPRFCIGSGFAMAEMTMHLSLVAPRLRLAYAGSEPPQLEFQINLRTRQDLRMQPLAR
jgi:cytochrome P450